MKQYEILMSEVPFKFNKFPFGKFELIPFRDSDRANIPQAILLIYEVSDRTIHSYYGRYISSLLSFIFRRRMDICRVMGQPYPPMDCPDDGKINHVSTACWDRFAENLSDGRYELHNEFSPNDEIDHLKLLEKLNNKILSFNEMEKETVFNSLYLHQLAYIVRPEDIELAFALLVGSIEALARDKSFFDFIRDTDWTEHGGKTGWDEFFRKEGFDEKIADKVRNMLINNDPQATNRFRKFIGKHLPESFWKTPDPDLTSAYSYEHWLRMGGHWDELIKDAPEHRKNEFRDLKNQHVRAATNSEMPIELQLWHLTEQGPYYNVPPFERRSYSHTQ